MKIRKRHDPLYDLSAITQSEQPQEQQNPNAQEAYNNSLPSDKQDPVILQSYCEDLSTPGNYGNNALCTSLAPAPVGGGCEVGSDWYCGPTVPAAILQYNQSTQRLEYGECRAGMANTDMGRGATTWALQH